MYVNLFVLSMSIFIAIMLPYRILHMGLIINQKLNEKK